MKIPHCFQVNSVPSHLKSYAVILILAAIGSTQLVKKLCKLVSEKKGGSVVLSVAEPAVVVLLLAVCTAFLVDGSFNPFLYFRF